MRNIASTNSRLRIAKLNPLLRLLKNDRLLMLLGFALIVCLVYWPGLNGPYVLDDDENILHNSSIALTHLTGNNILAALMSNDSGPLKRPVAALSFALNHYFNTGFYPTFAFKATNLAIHLLNGYLIYLLSLRLLETPRLAALHNDNNRRRIAVLTAALWSLHPIQLTSVLYVVQRMNSISALFVILGLIVYMRGRRALGQSGMHSRLIMAAGLIGGTLLGVGAKENAILLPIFAFIVELTLYRRDHLPPSDQKWLWCLFLLTILLPLVMFIIYLLVRPDFFSDAYALRSFSPHERLMTEARVLWFYISLLLVPNTMRLGLFHDDIPISTGLLQPLSTLPALIGIIVLLVFALIKFRHYPVASFVVLWYLAGHSLESGIFGLEIAYEHRNYLPSFGVMFSVVYTFHAIPSGAKIQKIKLLITSFPYAIVLIFGFSTWTWANIWKDNTTLATYHAIYHPDSPRTNSFAASIAIREKNDFIQAIRYTINGTRIAPEEVGFRLDMRLFLAYLESEINSGLDKAHVETQGKQFHIDALPNSIEVQNINGMIRFAYSPSNGGIIREMLRDHPISVYGVVALDKLTMCVLDYTETCKSLRHDAIEWLDSAAANPRTTVNYRALIACNAAKLHADSGDIQQALSYMSRADQLEPGTIYYELGKVEYLIKLGRRDEATVLLNRIEKSGASIKENRKTVELLRRMQTEIAGDRH